jgi:hypothetical protein
MVTGFHTNSALPDMETPILDTMDDAFHIQIKKTRKYNDYYEDGYTVYTASCMGERCDADDPTVAQVVLLKQLLGGGKITEDVVVKWLRQYDPICSFS